METLEELVTVGRKQVDYYIAVSDQSEPAVREQKRRRAAFSGHMLELALPGGRQSSSAGRPSPAS